MESPELFFCTSAAVLKMLFRTIEVSLVPFQHICYSLKQDRTLTDASVHGRKFRSYFSEP